MIALTHVPSPRMEECVRTHVAHVPIDVDRAASQHDAYCRMLEGCGVAVLRLDVNRELPDCVFIEDTAIVLDEVAVLTSMGTPSRRAEPAGIAVELRRYRAIVTVSSPATLEGGDVLRVGRRLLVGASSRTNALGIAALDAIARPYGYEVLTVGVDGCLHLKTACTALPDGALLVRPDCLDLGALAGFEQVQLPDDEPDAANVVLVGEVVCMSAAHPRTTAMIRARGFDVRVIDLSELAKAEGSATCLSLLFEA